MAMFETLHRTMAPNQTLKIACGRCGHRAEWSRAEAVRKLGPDSAPYDIRRKLKCGVCGGGAQVWI